MVESQSTPSNGKTKTISLLPAQYLYIHLSPIIVPHSVLPKQVNLDETTLRLHLFTALKNYLGDFGAAIPIDILSVQRKKVHPSGIQQDGSTDGTEVKHTDSSDNEAGDMETTIILRVQREDGASIMAAISSWVGSNSQVATHSTTFNSASQARVVGYVIKAKSEWLVDILGSTDSEIDGLFDFAR